MLSMKFLRLSSSLIRSYPRFLCILFAASLMGCATPSIYHWGKFEDGLYDRFVTEDHTQADAYLLETISAANQQNFKVPPGAYADYGFVLFKRGNFEGAKTYFKKEKNAFPESGKLMTKLIEQVEKKEAGKTESISEIFQKPVQGYEKNSNDVQDIESSKEEGEENSQE